MSYDKEVKEQWESNTSVKKILSGVIKIEFILISDRSIEFKEVKEFPDVPL